MKKLKQLFMIIIPLVHWMSSEGHCINDIDIWKEFVTTLKRGEFTEDMVRPHAESRKEPLVGFLDQMREKANWQEWEAEPEIIRTEVLQTFGVHFHTSR